MIKNEYKERTHLVTESILVSQRRYCDICGREITGPYWEIMTGHCDWGNDSSDSIEYSDICSSECLDRAIVSYEERSNRRSNTEYINVDHTRSSGVKGIIDQTKEDEKRVSIEHAYQAFVALRDRLNSDIDELDLDHIIDVLGAELDKN